MELGNTTKRKESAGDSWNRVVLLSAIQEIIFYIEVLTDLLRCFIFYHISNSFACQVKKWLDVQKICSLYSFNVNFFPVFIRSISFTADSWSIDCWAFSIIDSTSPIPSNLLANLWASNFSKPISFSDTPINLVGHPVTDLTDNNDPPLLSPSNLVRMIPVSFMWLLKFFL